MPMTAVPVPVRPPAAAFDPTDPALATDLDRVTRVATRALGAPVAQFNVVGDVEQVSVSSVGPEPWAGRRSMPRDVSYCQHVMRSSEALVIDNARTHPLTCENPQTSAAGIGAYLGVPVVLADGSITGALCVIDFVPRAWTAEAQALLEDLAASVAARIDLARQAAEHARARAHLDHVLSASGACLYVLRLEDGAPVQRWASENITHVVGYTPEETLAFDWWHTRVHPDDREATLAAAALVYEVGIAVHEYRFRHRDGHWIWVRDEQRLVRDANGRPVEIVGGWMDVSDQKAVEAGLQTARAELERRVEERTAELTRVNADLMREMERRQRSEAALERSEAHFRTIYEQAGVGIGELDLGGRWLRANPRLCAILGYTEDELRARTFSAITHPEDIDNDLELYQRALAGEIGHYQMLKRYVHRDGHLVWVLLMAAIVSGPTGVPDYCIAVLEDVTERKQASEAAHLGQLEVLERLAAAAEYRDDETGQHTHRVGTLAAKLARALGLPAEQVELVRRAAPLHDVGKIAIPDSILLKPGRLTAEEYAVMQAHALVGARILSGGRSPLVQMAERIARGHHERWDGTGYPDGVAGEQIPLEARIVAVADVYDALTSDRPYRPAWPRERVLAEIAQSAGTHFDPRVARAFLDLAAEPEDGLPVESGSQ